MWQTPCPYRGVRLKPGPRRKNFATVQKNGIPIVHCLFLGVCVCVQPRGTPPWQASAPRQIHPSRDGCWRPQIETHATYKTWPFCVPHGCMFFRNSNFRACSFLWIQQSDETRERVSSEMVECLSHSQHVTSIQEIQKKHVACPLNPRAAARTKTQCVSIQKLVKREKRHEVTCPKVRQKGSMFSGCIAVGGLNVKLMFCSVNVDPRMPCPVEHLPAMCLCIV